MLIEISDRDARRLNGAADATSRDALIRVYRHQADATAEDVRRVASLYVEIGEPARALDLLSVAEECERGTHETSH